MITGVILTKNEENNIVDAIESVSFCDQILVVDDNSTDRTFELLKVLKNENKRMEIYKRALNSDFSAQRNFALSKAKNEWVFFLDADERVSPDLKKEILDSLRRRELEGFYLSRHDFIWGRWINHGEVSNIKLLRLGRKSKGMWSGKVHEKWMIKGRTKNLNAPIKHYPHKSLTEFLREINFYTDIRAKELFEQGKKANIFSILIYPKAKFVRNYFLRQGFMDGSAGFVFAMLMSFHSFLVRGKLWMLWQK